MIIKWEEDNFYLIFNDGVNEEKLIIDETITPELIIDNISKFNIYKVKYNDEKTKEQYEKLDEENFKRKIIEMIVEASNEVEEETDLEKRNQDKENDY